MIIEELRKNLIEKRKESMALAIGGQTMALWPMARFNSVRENFEKREKKVKADLDEASKTWAELSKKFNPFDSLRSLRVDTERSRSIKWWQSLP